MEAAAKSNLKKVTLELGGKVCVRVRLACRGPFYNLGRVQQVSDFF